MLSEVEASHSCKRFFVVSLLRMTSLFLVLRYFIVSNEYFGLNHKTFYSEEFNIICPAKFFFICYRQVPFLIIFNYFIAK